MYRSVHDVVLRQARLHLAQSTALRQHERREPPLLRLREARRVDMRQHVRAVAMVVAISMTR